MTLITNTCKLDVPTHLKSSACSLFHAYKLQTLLVQLRGVYKRPSSLMSVSIFLTAWIPSIRQPDSPQQDSLTPLNKAAWIPSTRQSDSPQQDSLTPLNKAVLTPLNKAVLTPLKKTVLTPLNKTVLTPLNKTVLTPLNKTVLTPLNKTVLTPLKTVFNSH